MIRKKSRLSKNIPDSQTEYLQKKYGKKRQKQLRVEKEKLTKEQVRLKKAQTQLKKEQKEITKEREKQNNL